jgi:Spy/CpxP family protein refolding chaperone
MTGIGERLHTHSLGGRTSLALLCATFLSGALLGGILEHVRVSSGAVAPAPSGPSEGARSAPEDEAIPPQFRPLGLTLEQRAAMKRIVRAQQPVADSIMQTVLPRVRALDLEMRQQMLCVLTPDQQRQWMRWRARTGLSLREGEAWLEKAHTNTCPGSAARSAPAHPTAR